MSERIEMEKREKEIDRSREILFSLGCASYKGWESFYKLPW